MNDSRIKPLEDVQEPNYKDLCWQLYQLTKQVQRLTEQVERVADDQKYMQAKMHFSGCATSYDGSNGRRREFDPYIDL